MNNEEKPYVIYIPENFQTGINIFGENYATKNVVEAGVLSAIIFLLVMFLPNAFGLKIIWTVRLAIAIVLCSPCLAIGITGINGDSLLKFLSNIKNFKQRKRIILYNPRIKTKDVERIVQNYNTSVPKEQMLPRDKIIKAYDKIKENVEKRNREKARQQFGNLEDITANDVFFEDDVEYVETPVEYMTKSEYKEYLKREKQKRKELRRKARKNGKGKD